MNRNSFWITNGVNQGDEYRVIINSNDPISCNHCYKIAKGFKALGKIKYEICNRCLYTPTAEAIIQNFIAISKTKDYDRFMRTLEECENKQDYYDFINQLGLMKRYQIMYYNSQDESCAGRLTEDEITKLLAFDPIARDSFVFIGTDADAWKDEEFRKRVCNNAIKLIEVHKQ